MNWEKILHDEQIKDARLARKKHFWVLRKKKRYIH